MAGGASEIACEVLPVFGKFDFGEYPVSMGQDFEDLKADFESRDISWEAVKTNIGPCFQVVVEHLKRRAPEIRKLALELIDKQSLTHEKVNFGLLNREQLLNEMEAEEPVD